MIITPLKWRGEFKIEVSGTEMSLLRKLVELGLFALEGEEADGGNPLDSGEKKAMSYWRGQNPFSPDAKPYRKPRKPSKPNG